MHFISTRGGEKVTGAQAIVRGLAPDGGLYVPESFPAISFAEIEAMCSMDYPERAAFVTGKYLNEYDGEELLAVLRKAYEPFEGDDAAPLVRMDNGMYMLELFHGPTCADKDLSLALLPYLLRKGCELCGVKEELLVLVATSGDTGAAAIECFGGQKGVKVAVLYPEEGVSKMQKLQLCTTERENVTVIAVRGSFDDCQTAVKKMFLSEKCKEELAARKLHLSTANSINFGRIAPQIAYYFSAYCDLVGSDQIKLGEPVDFTLAAGNLSNLIAAYYAKRMGLPVGKIVCASNKNNAFSEFVKSGTFDTKRNLYRTMSPALDVLVASDLERLVFELSGRDAALTAERMQALASTGKYSVRAEELKALRTEFYADFTGEDETVECMYDFFMDYGYPMDTHTGVAMSIAQKYCAKVEEETEGEKHPMVVLSAASPYKFPQDVLYALTGNDVKDSFKGVKRIHLLTAMKVPESLKAIRYKPLLFKTVVSPEKTFREVLNILG